MSTRDSDPDFGDADAIADVLHRCAERNRNDERRRGASIHLPAAGTLTITGDLHDHGPNLDRILRLARLEAGPDRHVVLHELIHGENFVNDADLSVRTLARVAALKLRFPGQVHLMQSNHELAQLKGEGIYKGDIAVVDAFDQGVEDLYPGKADEVHEAVRDYVESLPLCVRVAPPGDADRGLFVAHSLPAPRRIEAFDKSVIDRVPTDADLSPKGSAYDMVWGRHHNRKITGELAEAWGVSVFLLGHQPADFGYETVADNALVLASDHANGVAVVLDLTREWTRDEVVEAITVLNEVPGG